VQNRAGCSAVTDGRARQGPADGGKRERGGRRWLQVCASTRMRIHTRTLRKLGRMVAAAEERGRRVVACASTLHARAVREHTACTRRARAHRMHLVPRARRVPCPQPHCRSSARNQPVSTQPASQHATSKSARNQPIPLKRDSNTYTPHTHAE